MGRPLLSIPQGLSGLTAVGIDPAISTTRGQQVELTLEFGPGWVVSCQT